MGAQNRKKGRSSNEDLYTNIHSLVVPMYAAIQGLRRHHVVNWYHSVSPKWLQVITVFTARLHRSSCAREVVASLQCRKKTSFKLIRFFGFWWWFGRWFRATYYWLYRWGLISTVWRSRVLFASAPSWSLTSQPGQLSLAILPWVGAVSTSDGIVIRKDTWWTSTRLNSIFKLRVTNSKQGRRVLHLSAPSTT